MDSSSPYSRRQSIFRLKRRVKKQAQVQQKSEEQARLELVQSLNAASMSESESEIVLGGGCEYSDLVANTSSFRFKTIPCFGQTSLEYASRRPVDSELRTCRPTRLCSPSIFCGRTAVADFSDRWRTPSHLVCRANNSPWTRLRERSKRTCHKCNA